MTPDLSDLCAHTNCGRPYGEHRISKDDACPRRNEYLLTQRFRAPSPEGSCLLVAHDALGPHVEMSDCVVWRRHVKAASPALIDPAKLPELDATGAEKFVFKQWRKDHPDGDSNWLRVAEELRIRERQVLASQQFISSILKECVRLRDLSANNRSPRTRLLQDESVQSIRVQLCNELIRFIEKGS